MYSKIFKGEQEVEVKRTPIKVDPAYTEILKGTSEGAKKAWISRKKGRIPLEGHPYHSKTDAELRYIQRDAAEAAKAMQGHSPRSESKYLDQVNDASTVLYHRKTQAMKGLKATMQALAIDV